MTSGPNRVPPLASEAALRLPTAHCRAGACSSDSLRASGLARLGAATSPFFQPATRATGPAIRQPVRVTARPNEGNGNLIFVKQCRPAARGRVGRAGKIELSSAAGHFLLLSP